MGYFENELQAVTSRLTRLIEGKNHIEKCEEVYNALPAENHYFLSSPESLSSASIYFQKLKSASDMVPALKRLHELGYKRESEVKIEKEELRIVWHYWNPETSHKIAILGYLDPGAVTCRRVQVGTETKEVPIYETQCDEPGEETLAAIASSGEEVAPEVAPNATSEVSQSGEESHEQASEGESERVE